MRAGLLAPGVELVRLGQFAQRFGIYLVLIALLLVPALWLPEYRNVLNVGRIVQQSAALAILAIGQTFVIACRMIDLSVGQLMGLIVVASCSLMEGRPEATIPAILLALAIGLTVGAINGFLNNRLRIHSLILTLGMLSILQGAIFVYTDRSVGAASPAVLRIGNGTVMGVPVTVPLVLVVAALAALLLHRTRFGLHVRVVGANEEGARRAGIDVARVKLPVFILSGVSAAIAGIILAGRLGHRLSECGDRLRARCDRRRGPWRHAAVGRPRHHPRNAGGGAGARRHCQSSQPARDVGLHPDGGEGRDRDCRGSHQPAAGTGSSMTALTPSLRRHAVRVLQRHGIWLVLLLLLLVSATLSDAFLRPAYLMNLVLQQTPVGITAIGVTLVMIAGGIDLSVGAIISLAAVMCAILMNGESENLPRALILTCLAGTLVGAFNGLLIAYNRVSPFILTLGTAIIVYGLTQIYSGGTASGVVSPGFREALNHRIGGIVPTMVVILLLAAACGIWIQRRTRFGRALYLIGTNPAAARLAALNLPRVTLIVYSLSGLFAALGGIALLARAGVSGTYTGRGSEFDVLAAAVLGGTTFEGGHGGIGGTIGGLLVLGLALNLVNLVGLSFYAQLIVKGAIIVAASTTYEFVRRSSASLEKPAT
jgi:ribose/xylose/arabinose/galactoside ABC-type transport system permease subunit